MLLVIPYSLIRVVRPGRGQRALDQQPSCRPRCARSLDRSVRATSTAWRISSELATALPPSTIHDPDRLREGRVRGLLPLLLDRVTRT